MRRSLLMLPVVAAVGALGFFLMPSANAAVSFDPDTGTGFIGKGDIQYVFEWSPEQLRDNAAGLRFTRQITETYQGTCTWHSDGQQRQRTHTATVTRLTEVDDAVTYSARPGEVKDVTGFNLNGFGATRAVGEVPVDGGDCLGGGVAGTLSTVRLTSSETGMLVTFRETTRHLW